MDWTGLDWLQPPWQSIVKSSSVNSFKNNLCNADLSKFLTVV